jgi:hypothetical protein
MLIKARQIEQNAQRIENTACKGVRGNAELGKCPMYKGDRNKLYTFTCCLFNDPVSISNHITSSGWIISE